MIYHRYIHLVHVRKEDHRDTFSDATECEFEIGCMCDVVPGVRYQCAVCEKYQGHYKCHIEGTYYTRC